MSIRTSKELVQFVDDLGNTDFEMADSLSKLLQAQGYREVYKAGRRSNVSDNGLTTQTLFYTKEDSDYVFACYINCEKNYFFPYIIDKTVYESILDKGDKTVFAVLAHNDKDYALAITKNRTNKKLHRVVIDAVDGDIVDHISHSTSVVLMECLRKVTTLQNHRHTLGYGKVFEQEMGYSFNGTYSMSEEYKDALIAQGFECNKVSYGYKITSPTYTSKDELYKVLNKVENDCLGEYRYNPLEACDTSKSLYMFLVYKLVGGISEDVYRQAKQELFVREYGIDMAHYYGLEVA